MILLVDGYNVIHRLPELRPSIAEGLENARNKLALLVSAWGWAHPRYECIVVFDGKEHSPGGGEQRLAGIRCLFSRTSHGGDDRIIRFVRECKRRKSDITVVSDDNQVGNNCRALGASVRPSRYIMEVKARPPTAPRRTSRDGKGINRRTAEGIDRELRKKFGL